MTTTSFGKEIRKLRIDHEQTQKDLAILLGVSPAFLSAVEVGKKQVPKNWTEKIAGIYQLSQMAIKLAWEFPGLEDETAKQILDILEKDKRS